MSALVVCSLWVVIQESVTNQKFMKPGVKYVTLASTKCWGVGNQMFGLAAMIGVNKANNYTWQYCLPCPFGIRYIFQLDEIVCCENRNLDEPSIFAEDHFAEYKPSYHNLWRHSDLSLGGFFQSWKYFHSAISDIKKYLKFQDHIIARARKTLTNKIEDKFQCYGCSANITLIALHVRRGDYLDKDSQGIGYKVATLDYIQHAIDHMLTVVKPVQHALMVSSDEIDWCTEHLGHRKDVIFLSPKSDPSHKAIHPIEIGQDLAMLTMCNHSIITVGTFGWWAAYLTGGRTIYYKDSPAYLSYLWNRTNHQDYYPPTWIGMT